MTDLRTAAQMALGRLETARCNDPDSDDCYYQEAIEALRTALAQGEQEPVAWKYETPAYVSLQWKQRGDWRDGTWTALYTVQPQRPLQGLTDEEVVERANADYSPEDFARGVAWAELKLKEKNT